MSAIYQATEHLDTLAEDSPDHTSVTIQVGASPVEQSSSHCGGSIISLLSRSTTVRYLLVVVIVAALIFLLERVLGGAVPEELRKALLDSVKQALDQVAHSIGSTPKPSSVGQ